LYRRSALEARLFWAVGGGGMTESQQPHLVLIEWVDSFGVTAGWEFKDDLEPLTPPRCQTVGFLIHDGEDHKTVAMTNSESQVLGRMAIPACAITAIRRLA